MSVDRSRVEALIRPEIRALSSYHVPDSSGYTKLDAMENPYDWPADVVRAWLAQLATVKPNRYPDAGAGPLKVLLRSHQHVPAEAGLLLGNGSDEIIQIILMAIAGPGVRVMAPEPTFVMYRQISRCLGLDFVGVPLAEDFSLDLPALLAAIETVRPAVLFLAYPNNPTGHLYKAEDIHTLLEHAPGLVVVDEAYAPFASHSFLPEVGRRHPNLLVMRTLSKLGLAGLRLGYLAGDEAWIGEFEKVRLPYNINSLTQTTVAYALEHPAFLDTQVAAILAERARLYQALTALPGVTAYPSQANFILFRCHTQSADCVFERLKAAGVLIKHLGKAQAALAECLRVTVGQPAENDQFLAVLGDALA